MGRVIGNRLVELNTYLENVIAAARGEPGHGFNRSKALLIAGNGENTSDFENNVDFVGNQMENEMSDVNVLHWDNWDGNWSSAKQWTKPRMPDNGIIFWNGHGNASQWAGGISYWDFTNGFYDLGNTNPAVFAASCKTGYYESGDLDMSIAEAYLAAGAGAYIGSTESTEHESTTNAFRRMYSRWSADESMGQALNQMKRSIWDIDQGYDHRKLWAFASNYYGDPKYGRLKAQGALLEGEAADNSPALIQQPDDTDLKIVLPELEFYESGGYDRVELPGGDNMTDNGGYPVPVWITTVAYRSGTSVQDVQLETRKNPVAYSGLSLPVVEGIHVDDLQTGSGAASTTEGWYPEMEQIFDWSVEEGDDGSTTLEIVIFPFYYHADTGDALFYRYFRFTVDTFDTPVQIDSLDAAESSYEPGDAVNLVTVVSNGERARDVILQPSVRDMYTNDVLGGLPLMTLHDLAGTATVDLTWDTRPYAAGDYMIVVEIFDTRGLLLDKTATDVRLGTTGAELTQFTADRETFVPGDQVDLSVRVANTGTVPITGTAVFLLHASGSLSITQMITAPINGLAPGATRNGNVTWDTTDAEAISYRVQAFFKFFGQTTEPMVLTLHRPRIYLPLVMGNP